MDDVNPAACYLYVKESRKEDVMQRILHKPVVWVVAVVAVTVIAVVFIALYAGGGGGGGGY